MTDRKRDIRGEVRAHVKKATAFKNRPFTAEEIRDREDREEVHRNKMHLKFCESPSKLRKENKAQEKKEKKDKKADARKSPCTEDCVT